MFEFAITVVLYSYKLLLLLSSQTISQITELTITSIISHVTADAVLK